ncbi:M15 family metallopeptidase [Streptomyces chartreusis]|uniref:M15 family metallopeptidase n=1 Tax=Streptomyces chartreusis TaxID=1969 RepID=UPI002E197D8E|nr:D-alanyl-D-alanine carboxypeptidase family protein [Streptomyces chartreusis]
MPRTSRLPGTSSRRTVRPLLFAGLVVSVAAMTAALGYQALRSSPTLPTASFSATAPSLGEPREPLGEADGAVPDGVTVFDDAIPAVAKLDPDLLRALRQAATDASDDGVGFLVSSGWRSPEYQDQLLREAVAEYGSEDEAARWVATATTSPHVAGDAVDIGRSDATEWLSRHGAEHGLCQIYRNEPWHYELRTEAIEHDCPRMFADPTQDPRTQQ